MHSGVINDGIPAINVIPDSATALIDIRIPPSILYEQVKKIINSHLGGYPTIKCTIEKETKESITQESSGKKIIQSIEKISRANGLALKSYLCEGTTDLRFYLQKNIEGIGFVPFTCKGEAHNTDESIGIDEIIFGRDFMYDFLLDFCA